MIPQLPSRNRPPRRREHTGGSTSSAFLGSEPSFGQSQGRSKAQLAEQERRESITYKHEWRIEDVSQLTAHVEGGNPGTGSVDGQGNGEGRLEESPSEILRTGRKTADEMYKFDLGA
jgi:hypothetical protein